MPRPWPHVRSTAQKSGRGLPGRPQPPGPSPARVPWRSTAARDLVQLLLVTIAIYLINVFLVPVSNDHGLVSKRDGRQVNASNAWKVR